MTETRTKKAEPEERLKEVVELSLLYDFYGELLGAHKKKIFEEYVQNDLSLSEIAEETGISRQGVHDIIKRCIKQLRAYEEALQLLEKFRHAKVLAQKIRAAAEALCAEQSADGEAELLALTDELLDNL